MKVQNIAQAFYLICVGILIGCSGSGASDPGLCDCVKNALKVGTSSFDANLQKNCEDYALTLTESEIKSRAMKGLSDCM